MASRRRDFPVRAREKLRRSSVQYASCERREASRAAVGENDASVGAKAQHEIAGAFHDIAIERVGDAKAHLRRLGLLLQKQLFARSEASSRSICSAPCRGCDMTKRGSPRSRRLKSSRAPRPAKRPHRRHHDSPSRSRSARMASSICSSNGDEQAGSPSAAASRTGRRGDARRQELRRAGRSRTADARARSEIAGRLVDGKLHFFLRATPAKRAYWRARKAISAGALSP